MKNRILILSWFVFFSVRNLIILTITCRSRRIWTFTKSESVVQIYFKQAKSLVKETSRFKNALAHFFHNRKQFSRRESIITICVKKTRFISTTQPVTTGTQHPFTSLSLFTRLSSFLNMSFFQPYFARVELKTIYK